MKKSSEFISAFSDLNDQIVTAIAEGSFSRVITLDKARQVMMQDLILLTALYTAEHQNDSRFRAGG